MFTGILTYLLTYDRVGMGLFFSQASKYDCQIPNYIMLTFYLTRTIELIAVTLLVTRRPNIELNNYNILAGFVAVL